MIALLIFFAGNNISIADDAASIPQKKLRYVDQLVDKFFTIVAEDHKTTRERVQLLKDAFLREIDFKWNARLALRSYWRQLNDEQKVEFVQLYKAMITHTWETKAEIILSVPRYAVKVDPRYRTVNTKDDDVDIVISAQGNRKVIITLRVRGGDLYTDSEFKVVNLTIEGIDMAESYNSQFKAYLEKNSIDKLLDSLRVYKNMKLESGSSTDNNLPIKEPIPASVQPTTQSKGKASKGTASKASAK